jgi:hypothetical protein
MARKSKQDEAKAKAAKQKKIAIGGGILLVALLAIQGPKTLKMLSPKPLPPLNAATATPTSTTPTVTPSDPNSLAAPTLGGTPAAAPVAVDTSNLVDAVPVSADPGQIESFQKFASKDPFAVQATSAGAPVKSGSSPKRSGGGATSTTPAVTPSSPSSPSSPSAPAPTSAVISLNGEVMGVSVGGDFPTAGATFLRAGSLFHVVSLTAKTAKIAIVGGSYADGAHAITLKMGTPLTLQNTADGTKYTLILEPPTTPLTGVTTTVATAPTSTTSVLP